MSNNIWDALETNSGAPVFKFADPGDKITGIVMEEPKLLPMKAYGSDQPKVDGAGNPVMQILLLLATDQQLDPEHDGQYRVYVDKPGMKAAVRRALTEAGSTTVEVGGELTIEFTGYQAMRSGAQAKVFTATYGSAFGDPIGVGVLGETEAGPA